MRFPPLRLAALAGLALLPALPAAAQQKPPPDNLASVQYFLSKPQDAATCAMTVENGRIVIPPGITNPAMSCPDMFSWRLFVEAIGAEFWRNWATDEDTWPGNPPAPDQNLFPDYPSPTKTTPFRLCAPGQSGPDCCSPASATNPGYDDPDYKAKHCPYFPDDHAATAGGAPRLRIAGSLSKAHQTGFAAAMSRGLAAAASRSAGAPTPSTTEITEGRIIRQSMAEIVYRNKPMFDYVFRNNLYNQDGIAAVFAQNAANIVSGAPYRQADGAGGLTEIDFPIDSVMIKSNWLNRTIAERMGITEDPRNPYVKMNILTVVSENDSRVLRPVEHWLVALHISSKDTPNWVWTTFEHVNNPGRCDYTGCNDSYGYRSSDELRDGLRRNYTRPKMVVDNLPQWALVLQLGQVYPGGDRSESLSRVFDALRIGTAGNTSLTPSPTDRAWRSYRLKGSQVNFTDSMGRPTLLGNSVTEGGFVSSSSCISCHARAGTRAMGTIPPALGVFENGVTDSGYLPSVFGTPNPAWYHRSGQPADLQVLQTDFVWGFLNANSLAPRLPAATGTEARPASVRSRAGGR